MSNRKAEARAKAKALREEEARRARKRERMIRVGVAVGVLALIVVIALLFQLGGDDGDSADGAVPSGANEAGDGVLVGDAGAPVEVDVWFDFQCPFCRQFETANGPVLAELIDDGTVKADYHPAAFLGEESERATNAFGCAIDAGRPREFMAELFENQPEERTGGYTEDDLIEHGAAVGLDGAEFEACVNDGPYAEWGAGQVLDAMRDEGIESTPTVLIDGEVLPDAAQVTPDEFRAAVDAAATS
jgi:protein-disulfide isomerase